MIGRTIAHFEVIEKLGEGGMGVVYKARDTGLDRFVALKVLQPDAVANPDRRRRFIQEAKSASALNHPNIVHIYEIGEADGSLFIAMEYVDGQTLDQCIRNGGLGMKEALRDALQIADAVATAHAAGIVHRDLKPGNIMVTGQGQVKVLDFGLAKLLEAPEEVSPTDETHSIHNPAPRTEEGVVIGTAAYMSPEQAEGKRVDARSDIFSFGAVLYEMVTRKRAFSGDTRMSTLSAVMREEPPPMSQVGLAIPPELDKVVQRCLRKDPAKRAQHMSDVKVQLEEIREDSNTSPVAQVHAAQPAPVTTPAPVPETARPAWKWAAVGVLVVLAAAAGAYLWRGQAAQPIDSLAVLPFTNVGGDPDKEYLSDGVTEGLTNALGQLANLKVASRASAGRVKDADPKRAGTDLGVRAVLMGKVRTQGDSLAISVELVDARDSSHIWGEHYDRKMSDLVAVQQEITSSIADQLRHKLSGQDRQQLAKRYSANTEAYQLYLQGHYQIEKATPEGYAKGVEYMHKAIELDPAFALAYEGLSYANWFAVDLFGPSPHELMPSAKETAKKALEIDNTLAEAHADLAAVNFMYDFDWKGAEREYRRAIELKPGYARAHEYYGWYLLTMGRTEEGVAESRKAAQLDPLNLETNWTVGENLYFAHRYDEAAIYFQKTIEMDSNYWPAHSFLGLIFETRSDFPKAIAEFEQARKAELNSLWPLAELGHAYALSGRKAEAESSLKDLLERSRREYVPAFLVASIYVGLGDRDHAFAFLEKAYQDRSCLLTFLPMDPQMDPLRSEPRFKELLKKIGL